MTNVKSLREAIESIKTYRNNAQAVAETQLELLSKIINKATEISSIPSSERTPEDSAILDFYYSINSDILASVNAADEYNKSLESYVKGFKILTVIASSQNEND